MGMNQYQAIFQSILRGDEQATLDECRRLLARGFRPEDILARGMIPAMDRLGELLSREELYIPQVLTSSRAMQKAVALLRPMLTTEAVGGSYLGTVVLGTVKGDIHTIGKNLVGLMLQSAGFDVVDLGVDVPTARFAQAVRENRAAVVAMSALLTSSMESMRKTIRSLRETDFGYPLTIIVGGGPITRSFARELQVSYGDTLMETVRLARTAPRSPRP